MSFQPQQISKINEKYPNVVVDVINIYNDFFGHDITVAGLLTGGDIIKQLKDIDLGSKLLLPSVLLKSGETILLDDVKLKDIEDALDISIEIVQADDGKSFVDSVIK